LRISGWSAGVWVLVAARRPIAGLAVAAGTVVALQRQLRGIPPVESARLAGLGHLYAGEQVASAVTRAWWPVALLAAIAVRRLRAPLAAAALGPAVLEWRRTRSAVGGSRSPSALARHVVMRLADDLCYGAGVWAGSLRLRSAAALIPDLSNWPPRGRRRQPPSS
jgi:hypothetical protein